MLSEFIVENDLGKVEVKKNFKEVIELKYLPKGTLLHEKGKPLVKNFFILKGIARCFMYKDGKEITTYFATDNSPIVAIDVIENDNKVSMLTIELLDDSIVAEIQFHKIRDIIFSDLNYSIKYCYYLDNEYRKLAMNQITNRFTTAKERYMKFCKENPEILRKVKLSHIASYLDISLETLSRIRTEQKPRRLKQFQEMLIKK
ncbi:Crp/Fnr family transcriptional regulator [Marinifilum caeruleilacunae]|uniref:Crp/Fnr family transcriptional regulator n=1 Tax=Marinifilum caeruleilacunae TaxID=2499076 RepID=A0ABX1WXE5_9BACT|nr:Crp/Fnr family transcriptional regulator [Marinifilum caeruleilacunae]NOU60707.1 Crp/Fnr family transcriptional regulator [Marinifilum caeruleilacunae]